MLGNGRSILPGMKLQTKAQTVNRKPSIQSRQNIPPTSFLVNAWRIAAGVNRIFLVIWPDNSTRNIVLQNSKRRGE
jgi:hypothetical protein